ncbi:MAG: phosphoglycerate kinase [Planctomycetes bacterium]|nr:phosphoglycerate kinase [Planctomycetota bacterium]
MTVSQDDVINWCSQLVEKTPDFPSMDRCLEAIPDLESLVDLPAGTRVLLRGDTDVVVKEDGSIEDDIRLRSLLETLDYGLQRGWVQLVYGHRGRDPKLSLEPIAAHLQKLLHENKRNAVDVGFIKEWFNPDTGEILDSAANQIAALPDGAIVVLENTRKYNSEEFKLEQLLWKAKSSDLAGLAEPLCNYANGVRDKLARVHINEGFAASNRDLSSTLVPLTMDRVALGKYIAGELRDHVTRARQSELVIFSGMKINKLDDLQQILGRGTVRMVIAAGSLAIGLKKAAADLAGEEFEMGLNGDPSIKKIYIPPERIAQARKMLEEGTDHGVEFVLPIDFILEDGSASDTIPPDGAQFDVGPKTVELQAQKVGEFIEFHKNKLDAEGQPAVAFHNGVFGKFEEDRFSRGTRKFIEQLKRMHDAGVQVYVGGGEGGAALYRYGDESWVTHCFTAGGTILKALGNKPIPYLKALYMKSTQ